MCFFKCIMISCLRFFEISSEPSVHHYSPDNLVLTGQGIPPHSVCWDRAQFLLTEKQGFQITSFWNGQWCSYSMRLWYRTVKMQPLAVLSVRTQTGNHYQGRLYQTFYGKWSSMSVYFCFLTYLVRRDWSWVTCTERGLWPSTTKDSSATATQILHLLVTKWNQPLWRPGIVMIGMICV